MDNLAKAFTEALRTLLDDRGFKLPLYAGSVASNGCPMWLRYTRNKAGTGFNGELLCDHAPGGVMQPPINVLFVDSTGNAARLVISVDERSDLRVLS